MDDAINRLYSSTVSVLRKQDRHTEATLQGSQTNACMHTTSESAQYVCIPCSLVQLLTSWNRQLGEPRSSTEIKEAMRVACDVRQHVA